jgi:hypothetical protein
LVNVDTFELLGCRTPEIIPFLLDLLLSLGNRNNNLIEFVAGLHVSLPLESDLLMGPLIDRGASIDEGLIHDVLILEHGVGLRV